MSKLEVIKDIYAAFQRNDVAAILRHMAENVEWEHDSNDHGIPWIKHGRGHAHVVNFFKSLAAVEIREFNVVALLEGPTQVGAVVHLDCKVKSTGKSIRDLEMHLWTLDDNGRVSRFRHLADTHAHVLALQP